MTAEGQPPSKPRPRMEPTAGYVAVGRALAPHGLRGEFRVEPLTDFPERFEVGRSLYVEGQRHIIEACRWYRDRLYVKLSGVDSAEAAARLRPRLLEIPENELKPLAAGQYYQFQVVGLPVRTTAGLPLGRVREVLATGSNDVFVVHGMMGEVLLPAIGDVVKKVDVEAGYIEVELVEGLVTRQRQR
ncbi:MAG: ribosome maturation factor RimM [Dehalococcoidia bacterium]